MRSFIGILSATLLCGLAGCDRAPTKPKADIYPVTGAIRYKDAPLADADVTFRPTGDTLGFIARGRTDKEGRYTLIDMHGNKGMVAGEYSVTVSRRVLPGGAVVPANDKTPPIQSMAVESLPPYLSSPEASTVTVTVTTEKADYDLDLR
jgi:hypothetical protein